MKVLLTILATLLYQHSLCQTAQFTPQDSETLHNLILTDSKLLLGTSGAVYRLDLALGQEERRALGSANRLLVADSPTGTLNGTVLSCDEGTCYLLEMSNLGNVKWEVPRSSVLLSGGGNAMGSFSISRNGTSDITFGEPPSSSTGRRFVKGALRNVFSTNPNEFVRYAFYGNANPNAPVDYLKNNFLLTNYTYFTIQPDSEELRVVRFCQKDPGYVNGEERNFESRFEIRLTCDETGNTGNILSSSATFRLTAQGPRLFMAVNRIASGSNVRNYLCTFSADQIDTLMLEKLRTCVGGSGEVGIDLKGRCPILSAVQQAQLRDPCMLRGILRSGLEVDMPLDGSILASPVRTEQVTSLVSLSLDNRLFLFTGTSSGRVHQYHVESDSGSTLVRSVTLEVGGASVVKMLSSDNGEYVYIMTSNKLVRHTVDRCNTYTSCHACTSSPDPVCGWCALSGLCTRQSLCPPVTDQASTPQTLWIDTTTSCPAITMATPTIIYLSELKDVLGGSMMVTLTTSNVNIPELMQFSYECVYRFSGAPGSVTRSASRSGESFTCLQPLVSDVPQIPAGQDSVDVEVSLRVAGVELATADTALEITDCSVHDSCTACITSGVDKCRWCPFSHECIADTASQTCSGGDTLTIRYGGSCPRIMAGSYRIHVNHAYTTSPLQIATSDLSTFQAQFDRNEFECVLCEVSGCTSPLFTLPASLMNSGRMVHCEGNHYPFSLTSSQLATELRIRVAANPDRRIDNPDSVGVTLYECGLMGAHCGQCLAIGPEYSCAYCGPTQGCQLTTVCPGTGFTEVTDFNRCNAQPEIVGFSPSAGPVDGGTILTISGTDLGADVGHVSSVTVGGVACTLIPKNYVPAIMIQCRTGGVGSTPSSGPITVEIEVNGQRTTPTATSRGEFQYKVPTLSDNPPQPSFGPHSGGSRITVTGGNLDIGSNHSVTVEGEECAVVSVGADGILCTTPEGSVGVGSVMVTVDGWSEEALSGFRYLEDPTFESIQPNTSFASGGTNYTITGTNLHIVQDPRLLMYVGVVSGRGKRQAVIQEPIRLTSGTCLSEGQTALYCPAPPVDLNGSSSTTVGFGLLLDNVATVTTLEGTLTVYSDPTFSSLSDELMFEQSQQVTITVKGAGFRFTEDQVQVRITPCETALLYCDCAIVNVTNQDSLTCEVANPSELTVDTSLTISVHVGNQTVTVGTIRVATNLQLLFILVPVIAAVVIISLVIFIVLVMVFCRNSRKKDQKYDQLILELERLESSVARECKLGFAELQTDLDEITEIVGSRLPYRDMQSYLFTTLFPGVRDHTVLHPLQLPDHRLPQVTRALEDFNYLIHDKKFLLLMVRSLEEERRFNIRDKSIVGSLLVVTLINRFDYATDILKSLLSDLIHKTVSNSSPKLLLRRTETVAEKMLTNWLAFCLHGYIMEHVGQPLYLTYRAVKTQLEKGPIDVITGEARYSLSEQKLIRQKVDVEVVDVQVDSEDGLRVQVKLLNCDTISQVKEKLLDATFKTSPISQRPSLKAVDLVWVESPTCQHILRDEDITTETEGTWKRINTLKHYGVRNGALFRLVRRKEYPGPGKAFDYPGSLISSHAPRQRALSEAEDGTRVWHLFKQLDVEDSRRSPFMNKKMVSEIYLPRMLSTKSILQKFVDDLFKSLFTMSHPPVSPSTRFSKAFPQSPGIQPPMGYAPGADSVPMAIKYLFDFLDDEAEQAKISDPDVVHMWKNNALSLRFWVNMIKNPEFVFDIHKSHTVDACLSVIAQAFIDGCSFADTKLNIDSPTSKLLYNKEVQGYRAQVRQYYQDIRSLPRVPEDAMQYYLKQLSVYQDHMTKNTGGFVVESALFELLRYASKYSDQIVNNLRTAGLDTKAQVFQGIIKVFLEQN